MTTIAAGASAIIYVKDNSTAAGTWGALTYGTGSSAADAATLAGYGIKAIGSVLNAGFPTSVQASSFVVDQYDRATAFVYTGGAGTVTLPDVTTLLDDYFFLVRNAGTGILTITPNGVQLIDDGSSLVLNPGESIFVISTSVKWYSIGHGRSVDFQFTQLIKDVSSGTPFTLTATEASNKILKFTGSPAANVTVIVPPTVAIYYTNSAISTAYTVTVKTSAGSGIAVAQGSRATLFCDSVNVLDAQTATVSGAIALEDGSEAAPSLKFSNDTDTGAYNLSAGVGFSVGGTAIVKMTVDGLEVTQGWLQLPGSTSPTQIADGGMVWDTDSDLLTVGTGAARKTMVDTDSAQTLTNKTLTSPVLVIKAGTGSTTEGQMEWNTTTDKLLVGTGAATKTLVNSDDVIAVAQGGTGQATATAGFDALAPTTTKGDLIAYNGTDNIRFAAGTNGYYLKANSGTASGLEWVAIAAAEVTLAGAESLTNKTIGMAGALDMNNNVVQEIKTATFNSQANLATTTGAVSIDWSAAQNYIQTEPTGNITYTFTAPPGVCHVQLLITSDGTSPAVTFTWPASVIWYGSTFAHVANKKMLVNFWYDGTNYHAMWGKQV